ncbi:ribosomal subunit interface protein [Confluentimicrobium naphthalenivorans]|jgi:ribosomal subunit interface protein|uniref:Ribosome hibernation promoting factor n=2 Tax=Roseobacteraceae TaxID=2854170 RepID=A0A840C9L8_9RHOB|nr:ribosomal subunit interface protein [Actibacterium naphthalenivorans]|tara:strand:+ start:2172 stop:2897 length:726 start_codon:yes stop_codon:yes gene_type:complete
MYDRSFIVQALPYKAGAKNAPGDFRATWPSIYNNMVPLLRPIGRAAMCKKGGGVMRYQISGKQIDIGEALQTHVKQELGVAVDKYAERPTDANIIFSRNAHEYVCEATVHLSTGLTAQAKAHATEIYAAFDGCRDKMEKQLRRYKRRLKDHHRDRAQPVELSGASSYILASTEDSEDSEPETLQPMIIAEMETTVPSLSVGEAVMQMELAGAPLLVFRNEKSGGINIVHRREDGNVGWIDP